jgi:hypothetical protein
MLNVVMLSAIAPFDDADSYNIRRIPLFMHTTCQESLGQGKETGRKERMIGKVSLKVVLNKVGHLLVCK